MIHRLRRLHGFIPDPDKPEQKRPHAKTQKRKVENYETELLTV